MLLVAEAGRGMYRPVGMALSRAEWIGALVWTLIGCVIAVGCAAALAVLAIGGVLQWMDRRP